MLEPADRLKVISRVKAIVVKRHFNIGNVDYGDWSRAVDEQIPTLLTADDNTFDEGVRNLLWRLKSSHTNFYHSDTNPTLPQHVVGATLRSVPRIGAPQWMFLDVFEDGPADRAGIRPGHLLGNVDGTPAIPPSFPAFCFGQEHQVTIELPDRKETRNMVLGVGVVVLSLSWTEHAAPRFLRQSSRFNILKMFKASNLPEKRLLQYWHTVPEVVKILLKSLASLSLLWAKPMAQVVGSSRPSGGTRLEFHSRLNRESHWREPPKRSRGSGRAFY